MRRCRVWLTALAAAAVPAGCGERAPDSARSEWEARRAELQQAIARDDGAIAERVELARVATKLGDGVAAEAAIKGAIDAGGNPDALRPILARALAMQGEADEALAVLSEGPIIAEMEGEAAWVAGDIHRDRGELGAAREAYDRAVRALPRSAMLWVDIARFRAASADRVGARDAVDYAIELDEDNGAALAFKAGLVRQSEGLTAALPWYDAALDVDPGNGDALIEQAATLGDMGRYKAMLAALRRAATVVPGDPRLYYLQAVVAARAGNHLLARSLLQRTRGEMDDVPGFMLLSAIVELELGGEAVAATWAERLVSDQPHNFTARRILAAASWADGDSAAAAKALAPIVARDDADSWSLLLAARIAAENGAEGLRESYAARAAALTRGDAEPFAFGQSILLRSAGDAAPLDPARAIPAMAADLAQGDGARAVARAETLRDANPGVAEAHILLGDAALAVGRFGLAAQSYRAAHNLDASERSALRLANALYRGGDVAGARAAIGALGRSDPASIAADRIAGHLAIDGGEWERAIWHFERVRRRIGDRDAVVLRELARAYAAKGDRARARAFIDRAYRLQPLNAAIMELYADLLDVEGDAQAASDLRDKAAQIGR